MADISYPLVNGVRYEWSSAEIKLNGLTFLGIKEVAYNHKLEPSKVYGVHPQPIGRTRGVYSAEGSVTMYLSEANQLIESLGDGYMEQNFDMVVTYAEIDQDSITDEIIGCRIKSDDSSLSQGADALVKKFDLDVMFLIRNGRQALINPLAAANLGEL